MVHRCEETGGEQGMQVGRWGTHTHVDTRHTQHELEKGGDVVIVQVQVLPVLLGIGLQRDHGLADGIGDHSPQFLYQWLMQPHRLQQWVSTDEDVLHHQLQGKHQGRWQEQGLKMWVGVSSKGQSKQQQDVA